MGTGEAVSAHEEEVEWMARAIFYATAKSPQARRWDDLYPEERERWSQCARAALASHPAVEALRELIEADDAFHQLKAFGKDANTPEEWFDATRRCEAADDAARTILAAIKEK